MNRFQFRSTLQAFGLTSRWPGRAAAARPVRGARSAVKAGLPADRRGSTLVIVISLLGMLTLLGLLTYTITSQEEISAEYFSDASKTPDSFTDPDLLFDHALRQLILGADQPERQSALHGGRASLMASMFGRDLQPYNGKGITLGWNGTSDRPFVDQDLDGASDNAHLLDLNLSPAAQDGIPDLNDATVGFPDPDVDYTYPDINSPWLGLRAEIPTSSSSTIPVVIPSFHRPQYLRNNGVAANEWYTDSGTRDKVFRAHKQHMAVTDNGTVTTTSRYFLTLANATAQGLSGPFPFPDSVDNPSNTNEGVWNGGSSNASNVRYDADADGDGFFEAVWMDLDFPAQSNAAGELYVPMFAMSVYDADALLNLNVHGNLAGDTRLNNNPFGGNRYGVGADGAPGTVNVDDDGNGIIDDEAEMGWGGSDDTIYSQPPSISRSNLGVNPSEVNPQWGLTATHSVSDPTNTLLQHRLFFGHDPASVQELSNMEWFFLTTGRPDFSPGASSTPAGSGDIVDVISGRYGESTRITNGVSTRNAASFPLPGKSFPLATFIPAQHLIYDDNLNYNEGGTYSGDNLLFPTGLSFLAWEHPLDLHGSGRLVSSGSYGLRRLMYSTGQHKYPSYYNYIVAPGVRYRNYGTHLMQSESALYQVDDVEEMFHEPSLAADQEDDSIFGTEEMAGLHLTDSDRIAAGVGSRLLELAPVNFRDGADAESRRLRFTTSSWDLKSYGKPYHGASSTIDKFRHWEFGADLDSDGNLEFPPQFGGTNDPFRAVVRNLLTLEARERNLLGLQRRLSLNHIVDRSTQDGRLRFRPLTPHPTNLGNTPVNYQSGLTSPEQLTGSVEAQEFLARRDRQNLCRDIYMLLYVLGGGQDDKDYTTANDPGATNSLYTHEQLEAMAQFAVNWVDALDPDDVITMFVYDKNPADGWVSDDYYYDNSTLPDPNDNAVGVVFGVEAQQLVLSEVLAILAKRVEMAGSGVNHDATEYDDAKHRDFLYVELENVSPRAVTFANEAWQIVVRPELSGSNPGSIEVEERRLTFTSSQPDISWGSGSRFTFGTAGDEDNKNGSSVRPSHFKVNPKQGDPMDDMIQRVIAPASGSLNADLLTMPVNRYRVEESPGSGVPGNGTKIPDGNSGGGTPAASTDLFHVTGSDTDLDGLNQGDVRVNIEIRRRLNPYRTRPVLHDSDPTGHVQQSRDNRYVVVDSQEDVDVRLFALQQGDNATQLPTRLANVTSRERTEPLSNAVLAGQQSSGDPGQYQYNSLGMKNSRSPDTFTLWQPHFNRDFYSPAELLSVPLYGPEDLTASLKNRQVESTAVLATAANVFLHPNDRTNRWYRLFEFVEVPSRIHRHPELTGSGALARSPQVIDIGRITSNPDLGFYRVPGKLQLNTLRHPHALGALLDDPDVAELGSVSLPDKLEPSARDWWGQFLTARDGADPITGLLLPGLPTAKPFRSFNITERGAEGIEYTLLRSLPVDSSQTEKRRLFEVGRHSDHTSGSVEQSFRHRLLAKVLNNTTNRSNVFIAYIQVDLFEAARVTDGGTGEEIVRIGAKRADSPGYRAMFVIDRSRALELLQAQHLPQSFTDPYDSVSKFNYMFQRSFNYRGLVTHEQRIR